MELNLENTKDFPLRDELREELLSKAGECVMSWSTKDGWPMAIPHIFLWYRGRLWLTTSEHKKRVIALKQRPQSCVVVSGEGNDVGGDRSMSIKTLVTVHEDRATKDWFFPAIAAKYNPDNPEMAQVFINLLDSPRRIILEHEPVKYITYDGQAMGDSLMDQMSGA